MVPWFWWLMERQVTGSLSMAGTRKTKPKKPYPSFPLTPHANGQWAKKTRGKLHYFGHRADPEAALTRYHSEAADLHPDRQPQLTTVAGDGLTVKDVCNEYLDWQEGKMEAGEIHARSFKECLDFVKAFARAVGEARLVSDLALEDFQVYRMWLAKRLAPGMLMKRITIIRSICKYTYEVDLLNRPMKFGAGFSRPSAASQRKANSKKERENGRKLFTKGSWTRKVIPVSKPAVKVMQWSTDPRAELPVHAIPAGSCRSTGRPRNN